MVDCYCYSVLSNLCEGGKGVVSVVHVQPILSKPCVLGLKSGLCVSVPPHDVWAQGDFLSSCIIDLLGWLFSHFPCDFSFLKDSWKCMTINYLASCYVLAVSILLGDRKSWSSPYGSFKLHLKFYTFNFFNRYMVILIFILELVWQIACFSRNLSILWFQVFKIYPLSLMYE